jgi:hypothetical protein
MRGAQQKWAFPVAAGNAPVRQFHASQERVHAKEHTNAHRILFRFIGK